MTQDQLAHVIYVMDRHGDDDLERARAAFRGLSQEEMDKDMYGYGYSRAEYLKRLEDARKLHKESLSALRKMHAEVLAKDDPS